LTRINNLVDPWARQ